MSVLRALMVTRRYWPLMGDDEANHLAALAAGLQRRGVDVELVAARYGASWPKRLCVGERTLHRPAAAPRTDWSLPRYVRSLSQFLQEQSAGFDLLYAHTMRDEAAAVVEVARQAGLASVVRYQGRGEFADAKWWSRSRTTRRCKQVAIGADRIIASHAAAQQDLIAGGVDRQRVVRIDNGFPAPATRDATARTADVRKRALRSFAQVNADLFVPLDHALLLTTNSMSRRGGLQRVIDALPEVMTPALPLRTWLIGDGPLRETLYNRLKDHGLLGAAAMPGTFTTLDVLLQVADIYCLPSCEEGLESFLPRVIGAGIPAIVIDTPATRKLLDVCADEVTWFDPALPGSLAQAMLSVVADLPAARHRARNAAASAIRARRWSDCVDRHADLFSQLTGKPLSGRPSTTELIP